MFSTTPRSSVTLGSIHAAYLANSLGFLLASFFGVPARGVPCGVLEGVLDGVVVMGDARDIPTCMGDARDMAGPGRLRKEAPGEAAPGATRPLAFGRA